jgi:AcrR family transcriptional regulator
VQDESRRAQGTVGDSATRRSDGARTHGAILERAVALASIEGLGSLTIGRLARELGISKSGVFAHFGSKDRLQSETVAAATEIFEREVFEPGLAAPEGLARLERLCEAYLSYLERGVFPGGCFFAHLLAEFDAPDGPIHDAVLEGQRRWIALLEDQIAIAQRRGELDPNAEGTQLAFELYAPLELANYLSTLNRDPTYVERARCALRRTIDAAARRKGRHGARADD